MPSTTHHPAPPLRRTFTTRTGPELVTILELQSRCYAAARLAMMGASFSPDDRADAASRLLTDLWAEITSAGALLYTVGQRVPTSLQGDGVNYSAKSRQKSKDDAPDVWADIPAVRKSSLPPFSTLTGRAANLRRSLERDRLRDRTDAAERARTDAFLPYVPGTDPEVRSTPAVAAELAAEMATAMGTDGRPAYVAAYTAARATSGEASDAIAAELELAPAAYRKALQRGRDAIAKRYASQHELAEALYVPDGGVALKPSASRNRTHAIGERDAGWRDSQRAYGIRPVVCGAIGPLPAGALPAAPPAWARDLKGTTATRLRHAARRQAETSRLKSEGDRMADRLAAGLAA